ncbi:MAG: OB-fold domain-containing protein [Burkholderiaceae bacterium]
MANRIAGNVLKPQPRVNGLTRPFWDGANERRLIIQRCAQSGCGKGVFYPRVCCPFCKGPKLKWFEASGRGRIISHTTVHRTHHDGFNAEAPYVFAAVVLDEGPYIYAQIPGAPMDSASLVGKPVVVDFAEHGPGRRMPVFRLADSSDKA